MDRFFKDKHGKWAIWQTPNILLTAWFAAMILAKLLHGGRLDRIFEAMAFGTLFAWAWGEILRGESHFRRVLGAGVLILIIVSHSR